MTILLPFLNLVSIATIQSFLKGCITYSWVNWLRNGKLSMEGQVYMMDPVKCILKFDIVEPNTTAHFQ